MRELDANFGPEQAEWRVDTHYQVLPARRPAGSRDADRAQPGGVRRPAPDPAADDPDHDNRRAAEPVGRPGDPARGRGEGAVPRGAVPAAEPRAGRGADRRRTAVDRAVVRPGTRRRVPRPPRLAGRPDRAGPGGPRPRAERAARA